MELGKVFVQHPRLLVGGGVLVGRQDSRFDQLGPPQQVGEHLAGVGLVAAAGGDFPQNARRIPVARHVGGCFDDRFDGAILPDDDSSDPRLSCGGLPLDEPLPLLVENLGVGRGRRRILLAKDVRHVVVPFVVGFVPFQSVGSWVVSRKPWVFPCETVW
ncbi:MAG: hypothetical protein ACRC1K_17890 [Planctomycetia bacterium]